jgi:hypothetical protein
MCKWSHATIYYINKCMKNCFLARLELHKDPTLYSWLLICLSLCDSWRIILEFIFRFLSTKTFLASFITLYQTERKLLIIRELPEIGFSYEDTIIIHVKIFNPCVCWKSVKDSVTACYSVDGIIMANWRLKGTYYTDRWTVVWRCGRW